MLIHRKSGWLYTHMLQIQACRYQVDDCQPRAPREALYVYMTLEKYYTY